MNSLIAQTKIGSCSRCGSENTQCKKRGKVLLCTRCCTTDDVIRQMDKAKKKQALKIDTGKVKKLVFKQDINVAERSALIGDVDDAMSVYIRLREADENGYIKCFCCPLVIHWKEAHNSHYIRRGHMATRFMIDNCRPSCPQCNSKHNDNVEPYRSLLEADKPGIIEYLEEQRNVVYRYTVSELKGLLLDFRQKAKFVKSKLIEK